MRHPSLALFILVTLTLGCISVYPPQVQKAIQECNKETDCVVGVDHGHGWCDYPRMHCIRDLAIEYDNPAICEESAVLNTSAVDERCDTISLKERCYYEVALQTGDSDLCDKIGQIGFKWDCIERTSGDYGRLFDLCPKQDEIGVQECQYNLISQAKDASLCLRIDNYDKAKDCIISFAWEFHDSSLCSLLENERDIESCKAQWG